MPQSNTTGCQVAGGGEYGGHVGPMLQPPSLFCGSWLQNRHYVRGTRGVGGSYAETQCPPLSPGSARRASRLHARNDPPPPEKQEKLLALSGLGVWGFELRVWIRGVFLPPFVRKWATPLKGILHYEGVEQCSTKNGKKTPPVWIGLVCLSLNWRFGLVAWGFEPLASVEGTRDTSH